MNLRIKVQDLKDGRFRIRYFWSIWEPTYIEYFENAEAAAKFVADLVKNTKWK